MCEGYQFFDIKKINKKIKNDFSQIYGWLRFKIKEKSGWHIIYYIFVLLVICEKVN